MISNVLLCDSKCICLYCICICCALWITYGEFFSLLTNTYCMNLNNVFLKQAFRWKLTSKKSPWNACVHWGWKVPLEGVFFCFTFVGVECIYTVYGPPGDLMFATMQQNWAAAAEQGDICLRKWWNIEPKLILDLKPSGEHKQNSIGMVMLHCKNRFVNATTH